VDDTDTTGAADSQAIGGDVWALVRIVVGLAVLGTLTIGLSIGSDLLAVLG
jgi:hypothetical protein